MEKGGPPTIELLNRAGLALENVALRQRLLVLGRTVKRPRINDRDPRPGS